ncbi:hypothetical protein D6774_02920 [Candidatus Woesearchaeota archaeon]|nr:MAG: hypothetical protein D6774_02920 [Candidatus Woesearchaeota archaeon]
MMYSRQPLYQAPFRTSYASNIMYSATGVERPLEYSPSFVEHVRSMPSYESPSHYASPTTLYEGNEQEEPTCIQHIDQPTTFLKPNRAPTRFIGKAEEVKEYLLETWDHLMHKEFPCDIDIHILSYEAMKKHLKENFHPGILGFARNGHATYQRSRIFVREGELDIVLETLGHELGHVLTPPLDDPVDEEAKAYAFEAAWVKKIKEFNIAGLASNFKDMPEPARNGVHDKAARFVRLTLLKKGDAKELFSAIAKRTLRCS